jgi:hypothetical protein
MIREKYSVIIMMIALSGTGSPGSEGRAREEV